MKKFPYLTFFSTWLLVFCGTLGAPLCVVTAYDLPYHLSALILAALIISGFMTLLFTLPELGAYMLIPFGVTVLLISVFRWKKLYSGAAVAIRTIQSVLSRTIAFIPDPGVSLPAGSENYAYFIGFFVGAVMVAVALLISWGLVSGESMFLPFLVPLPLVALSLIYTDLPPAGWACVLVCLYYGGVLFTGGLRLHQGGGIGRVTLLALGAVLLTVGLLVRMLPPEEYEPQSTQERVEQVMRQAASVWEKLNRLMDRDIREREDLSREGELKSTGEHVMDVKTTRTGRLYLRGASYGQYDGRYWSMAGEFAQGESLFTLGGSLSDPQDLVEIQNANSSLIYTPYAVLKGGVEGQVRENYIVTEQRRSAYGWTCRTVPSSLAPRLGNEAEQAYAAWAKKTYVTLTRSKRESFLEYLKPYDLPDADDPYALAQAIAAILRGTAEYDLDPGETPRDQDFALYFLTVRKRGYCVHYASALTALLQAKGVPARFVVGYVLSVETADTWVEVTDRNAHAWTEVYVDGWGWVPIEATGGDDPRLDMPAPESNNGEPDQPTPEPSRAPEDTPEPETTPSPTPEPSGEPSAEPTPEPTPEIQVTTPTPDGAEAQQTPTPAPEEEPDTDPEGGSRSAFGWLLWLLLLPALVFLYIRLRKRVCAIRTERMLRGDGNRAVLYGYGELQKLVRHGADLSDKARTLADEAAFSDHALGEEHKRAMAGYVRAAHRELERKLPWYKLWYLRYLLWLW